MARTRDPIRVLKVRGVRFRCDPRQPTLDLFWSPTAENWRHPTHGKELLNVRFAPAELDSGLIWTRHDCATGGARALPILGKGASANPRTFALLLWIASQRAASTEDMRKHRANILPRGFAKTEKIATAIRDLCQPDGQSATKQGIDQWRPGQRIPLRLDPSLVAHDDYGYYEWGSAEVHVDGNGDVHAAVKSFGLPRPRREASLHFTSDDLIASLGEVDSLLRRSPVSATGEGSGEAPPIPPVPAPSNEALPLLADPTQPRSSRTSLARAASHGAMDHIVERLAALDGREPPPQDILRALRTFGASQRTDIWHRAVLLMGFVWSSLGNPSSLWSDGITFESPVKALRFVRRMKAPSGAAAAWILGKLEAQRPTSGSRPREAGLPSREDYYAGLTGDVPLNWTVLLPGLRDELSPDHYSKHPESQRPPVDFVPVPFRFRASADLSAAAAAEDATARTRLFANVRADIRQFENLRGTSGEERIRINLELLNAELATVEFCLSHRKVGKAGAHDRVQSSVLTMNNVDVAKLAEWDANCHAGLACAANADSREAHEALSGLLEAVELALRSSGGRTAAFRVDAIYHLALRQDATGEFRRRFSKLLDEAEARHRQPGVS